VSWPITMTAGTGARLARPAAAAPGKPAPGSEPPIWDLEARVWLGAPDYYLS
jgi:hypothetical protein